MVLKFLLQSLRNGGASELLDLVSPSFFDVVPVTKSIPVIKNLVTNGLRPGRSPAFDAVQAELSRRGLAILIGQAAGAKGEPAPGQWVLRVYFAQILFCPEALLDMRHRAFRSLDGKTFWNPMSAVHRWDPDFIAALRDVYRGFYGNDPDLFRAGLAKLNLSTAEDLFRRHFGEGDQTHVLFSVDHFRKSFHDIFLHCRENGITLPVDFLPLGMLLGTLYENLSTIGEPQDARGAFECCANAPLP